MRQGYDINSIVIWNANTHTTIKKLQKGYQLNCTRYNASGSLLGFSGIVGVHDVTNDEFPLLFVIEQIGHWRLGCIFCSNNIQCVMVYLLSPMGGISRI
jgi:hypothetical protein